jgi:hypothetical protein
MYGSEAPIGVQDAELHAHNFEGGDCLSDYPADIESLTHAEAQKYVGLVSPPRFRHVFGDPLVRILELAYAKHQKKAFPHLFGNISDDYILEIYNQPPFHYRADVSMRDLFGLVVDSLHASETFEDSSRSFADEFAVNLDFQNKVKSAFELYAQAPHKYFATVCTFGLPHTAQYHDPGMKIGPWHDHILEHVDLENRKIHIVDPYNSRITLVLHMDDFFNYFYLICLAPVSSLGGR